MTRITSSEVASLMEAYNSVYAPQEQINDEQLVEEIFEDIAYALISQGRTAVDVLEYFADVDDEVIIEDVIALSEGTLIFEEVVSEEYIEEQFQQLDEIVGAALRIASAGLKAAKFAPKGSGALAKTGAALQGSGKAATRVAQQGTKASAVVRPAVGRAVQGAKNAIGGAVSKVKDVAKGALGKLPGGSGGKLAGAAKFVGKAALGGAAFEGGMRAVQGLAGKGGNAKTSPAPKTPKAGMVDTAKGQKYKSSSDGKMYKNYNDALAARNSRRGVKPTPAPAASSSAAPSGGSGGGGGSSTPAPKSTPSTKVAPAKPAAAAKPATGTLGKTSFERRTPTSAELKGAQAARAGGEKDPEKVLQAAKSAGGALSQATAAASKPAAFSPGSDSSSSAKTAPSKPTSRQTAREKVLNQSYEYDAYDVVLEYLLSQGHVDTVDEAHYVMLEMDAEAVKSVLEEVLDEDKKYDRNRQRAAQRAAARNEARKQGKTGAVPGVGYVSPRPERETYRDSSGTERHKTGARMPKNEG